MSTARPTLIVGAGPTGLTAAIELARRGHPLRLIEQRDAPSPLSRAVGILPNSMDILGPSGAADSLRAEAVQFSGFTFHIGARPKFALDFPMDDPAARILGLAQNRTEYHLAQALARYGGTVDYGVRFERLTQHDDHITAHLSDGSADRYARVIGADGTGSAVRAAVDLPFEGYEVPGDWSIADVESADWPTPTRFQGYLLEGGDICIVAPLGATRFRVIASRKDALAALPVAMNVDQLHRADSFRIPVRAAPHFQRGRVFLAGDAAHCHSPVGGRGMNLGIADAAELAARIDAGTVAGYEAARRPKAHQVITTTERIRRTLQGDRPLLRGLAMTGMSFASHLPFARHRIARRIAKL